MLRWAYRFRKWLPALLIAALFIAAFAVLTGRLG